MNMQRLINSAAGLAGVLALALSATFAFAEVKEVMKIKIKTDSGIAETVSIENLGVGESDVFFTESGKQVLVSRFEDAMQMEIDGEVIDVQLPKVHGAHVNVHAEGHEGGHVVKMKLGDLHEVESEGIFVTEDDEVLVSEHGFKHVIVRREMAGDGAAEGDVECNIEIEVTGDTTEEEVMEELGDLCAEGAGHDGAVRVIKIRKEVESEG